MGLITLDDTYQDVMVKMCAGNIGALSVLNELMKKGADIDPDAALGPLAAILAMDDMNIRGPLIWQLYKDVCKQDLPLMAAVLRARQLGFVSEAALLRAIANYGKGIDPTALAGQVKARLPRFGWEPKKPA